MDPMNLDHVGLVFDDPAGAAERLGAVLGLPAEIPLASSDTAAIVVGQTRLELIGRGHPAAEGAAREGLHHLGFAAEEPAALGAGETLRGLVATSGARGVWLDPRMTTGVRVQIATRSEEAGREPAETNVRGMDHVGIASADNGVAREIFCERMGFRIESSQTDTEALVAVESFVSDKYGVVYHERPAELVGGLRVCFITVGDCELEFLEEVPGSRPDLARVSAGGSTRGDRGAIGRFVEARGPGLHHLAFRVQDIEAALRTAREAGAAPIDERGRPGSRRSEIAFLHPRSTCGVLVHFVSRASERHPRSVRGPRG
ncbi:MAG: hypothetical protein GEU78_08885 [Actinobacteria bacterium]|nr:hypothetical protein [Actinomycetota bacterium]